MKAIKRNLAILLAACLVITSVVPAFAEEIPEQQTETVNEIVPEEATPNEATYGSEAADPENEDIEKASPSDAKKADSEVFIREATVDGVIVKVEAPAGTFPADAELSVIAVDEDTVDENIENVEEKIDEAVEDARKKDKDLKDAKVLSSLKFDIKIVLPDGTELQPEGNKVKVTFTLAEKVGDCVDINVYHLKEVENTGNAADTEESDVSLKAEKVEGTVKTVPAEETAETAKGTTAVKTVSEEVDEEGVLADGPITNDVNDEVSEFEGETDGFSYYTVEFTYEELQYVLPGDSSIALSDILAQLMIEGTVADVEVSSPELFSADKDSNGVWTVTAHKAFSSTEKMTVTMDDGNEYEIVVTDTQGTTGVWENLRKALIGDNPESEDISIDGSTITLNADFTAGTNDTTLTVLGTRILDLNGHDINGKIGETQSVGSVIKVNAGANLTLKDSSTGEPGKITGGIETGEPKVYGGGVYVAGGEFTMTGGEIYKNKVSHGGGVYVAGGKFTMTGGSIKENDAGGYGGGVYVKDNGQLDLSGTGSIFGNTSKYGGGVCFSASDNFNMSGGSITENTATESGGGVMSNGTFSMSGGSIASNKVDSTEDKGGGVYNVKTFIMTGGSIEKNKADNGSGVYNSGTFTMNAGSITENKTFQSTPKGGGVYNAETFTMTGGNIKKNNSNMGGGVYNNKTFTMTGGSITENTAPNGGGVYYDANGLKMTVGGDAAITGNNKGGTESHISSNVFLKEKRTIAIGTGDDAPRSGMSIGVKLSADHDNEGVITSAGAGQYADCFSADESNHCIVVTSKSELKIIEEGGGYHTVTFNTTGGTPEEIKQNVEDDANAVAPIPPTKSGYDFAGWYTDSGCTVGNEYDFSNSITADITLYAKWAVKSTITITSSRTEYELGETVKLEIVTTGIQEGTKFTLTDGMHTTMNTIGSDGKSVIYATNAIPGTYTYTASIQQYGISDSIEITVKKGVDPKPDPKKKESSSGANSIYPGTSSYPVSDGKWTQNADGTWSYVAGRRFTSTWGFIANPAEAGKANWYYFDSYGKMLTGWQKLYWNGAYRWFYFSKKNDGTYGACQLGGITPDGYKLGSDGAWIEK